MKERTENVVVATIYSSITTILVVALICFAVFYDVPSGTSEAAMIAADFKFGIALALSAMAIFFGICTKKAITMVARSKNKGRV